MKKIRFNIKDHHQRMEILKIFHDNNYRAEVASTGKVKENICVVIEVEVPDGAVKGVTNAIRS